MVNFPIEQEVLRPHTPQGTEIDDWRGTTYVSLVAFLFLNTRVKGIAIPLHRNFEEINLRFYVRSRGPQGWRRGVVFVREVVPKRMIAWVARWLYNENYIACPTRSSLIEPSGNHDGSVEYGWKHRKEWLTISAEYSGQPGYPTKDSLAEFISEHYWGYAAQKGGGSLEYQVEHPQWHVWSASKTVLSGDFARFYGPEFASALATSPNSVFVADGSSVIVHEGRPLGVPRR